MELQLCKIFVGNVPFQCSQLEFKECFEKIIGFVKAEIICKSNTSISRGFGFVTFDTPENARKILGNNLIQCNGRTLRFTEYGLNDGIINNINMESEPPEKISLSETHKYKNFIVVKNIKENMSRETLYKIFEKYGPVGRHFIATDHDTGNLKSYAMVEMLDQISYDLLIKLKESVIGDTYTLEISKWKPKNYTIMTQNVKEKKTYSGNKYFN